MKIIFSYGGGTNSKAALIGMRERDIIPDDIIFCDTKGEKPHTYQDIQEMSVWCINNGFPPIRILTNEKASRKGGLENMCLEAKSLPSIAYGFKTCSLIFKKEPFDDYLKKQGITEFERWVGFDSGESRRAKVFEGTRYPLIEWGWFREDCVEAIKRAGLSQPGKSSCFFCPSSKKQEVLQLRKDYPELAKRAVEMEQNAILTEIKGLGRNYAWADLYKADDDQGKLFEETDLPIICECFDGDCT